MKRPDEPRLPADLEQIATRLSEHRIDVDELRLDQLKQRALGRSRTPSRGRFFIARLATALTTFVLLGVFGGALAVAQLDSHSNSNGGAADAQYTSAVSAQTANTTAPTSTSTSPASTGQTANTASSTLPFTGQNVLTVFLVAALLVGSGLLIMPRRRRRE